jgi:hypothetical protein
LFKIKLKERLKTVQAIKYNTHHQRNSSEAGCETWFFSLIVQQTMIQGVRENEADKTTGI